MRTTQHSYGGVNYVVVDLGCLAYYATTQALPTSAGGIAVIRANASSRASLHAEMKNEIRNLPPNIRERLPLVH